jgi:hypothetical protein
MPGKRTAQDNIRIKLIWEYSTDRVVEGGPFVVALRNEEGDQAFLANSFQSREEAIAFIRATRKTLLKLGKWESFSVTDMREEACVENYRTREEAEASHKTKQ